MSNKGKVGHGLTRNDTSLEAQNSPSSEAACPGASDSVSGAEPGMLAEALDTSLTNRVSNKYNSDYFQPLRWGVDSLYVSFTGELHPQQESRLEHLKKLAQSDQPDQQALSQLQIENHLFEVKDKATGMFGFVLEDNCFRIQLARSRAKRLPMAYVKISSEYLTHQTPEYILDELRRVLEPLGTIDYMPSVSRIDLFVDFASPVDMESWNREAWVTRSNSVNQYSVNNMFSGWAIGLGGSMVARLYDKVLEIVTSKKTYLIPLWEEAGWTGQARVWRMEFQFNREILRQLQIKTFAEAQANLNGLWAYATSDWLRLTIPNDQDGNRSRWPLHPLWDQIAAVDFGTEGGLLSREFSAQRIPCDRRLFDHAFSVLTSFMARESIKDFYEGMEALNTRLYHYLNNRAMDAGASFDKFIDERVAVKARRFNSMRNENPGQYKGEVAAYRRMSDGE